MSSYDARLLDLELDDVLTGLPAVSLVGPKGVGKTKTAMRRISSTFLLDDPTQVELLQANPERLRSAPGPILIDEWQRWPPVWDLVRRAVDDGAEPGRFILTGSSSPVEAPTHSGAGRIVDVRMRPMSLAERGGPTPTMSMEQMLNGRVETVTGSSNWGLPDYTREIVRSGLPGIRHLNGRAASSALAGYIDRVVERDFPEQGLSVRKPDALRAWLAAYAAATGTTAAYNAILDAATPGQSDKPSRQATTGYRDVLSQLWLLDPVPGWLPSDNMFSRLAQAPKHHLADPALAAHLLDADEESLLSGGGRTVGSTPHNPLIGALFESLVTLSVRVYAQAADAAVRHLRTRNGDREVDLIVQRRNGALVALEVKLSPLVNDADVKHLLWLREQIGPRLMDAAVITTGAHAYRRKDGIAVIPAALLGP